MITQEEIPYNKNEIEAMVKTIENLRKEKSEFIEKACEWLDHNRPIGTGDPEWEDTINEFKKAMNNELQQK